MSIIYEIIVELYHDRSTETMHAYANKPKNSQEPETFECVGLSESSPCTCHAALGDYGPRTSLAFGNESFLGRKGVKEKNWRLIGFLHHSDYHCNYYCSDLQTVPCESWLENKKGGVWFSFSLIQRASRRLRPRLGRRCRRLQGWSYLTL